MQGTASFAIDAVLTASTGYQYLTGPRFKQRVEAIIEAFSTMQVDLDKERKAIIKQWAKRQAQIERVMNATVGMYGDLQGILSGLIRQSLSEFL